MLVGAALVESGVADSTEDTGLVTAAWAVAKTVVGDCKFATVSTVVVG